MHVHCPHNRNPYNHNIYDDSDIHYNHRRHDSVFVEEHDKIAEIRDSFNNLRYKVHLKSIPIYLDDYSEFQYVITVYNCFSDMDEYAVLRIPRPREKAITAYDEANRRYQECIQQYKLLVKAETQDIQTIDLYKHKLGYQMTKPECCETCKWCRVKRGQGDYLVEVTGRLECHNPENQEKYQFNDDRYARAEYDHDYYGHHGCHGHQSAYDPRPPRLDVYPLVEAFGKCPKYVPNTHQLQPIPGENLLDVIDRRLDVKYRNEWNPALQTETTRAMYAETTLSLAISSHIADCAEHCSAMSSAIRNEINRSTAVDEDIYSKLSAIDTRVDGISAISADIVQKISQTSVDILSEVDSRIEDKSLQICSYIDQTADSLKTGIMTVVTNVSNDLTTYVQTTYEPLESGLLSIRNDMNVISGDISNIQSSMVDYCSQLCACSSVLSLQIEHIDSVISDKLPGLISTMVSTVISTDVIHIISSSISTVIIPNISAVIQDQVENHMPVITGNRNIRVTKDYNGDGVIDEKDDEIENDQRDIGSIYTGGGAD